LKYTADHARVRMHTDVYIIILNAKTSFSHNCLNNRVTVANLSSMIVSCSCTFTVQNTEKRSFIYSKSVEKELIKHIFMMKLE